jgi:hypothetical protein
MAPISNTIYTVCLFLALISLSAWSSRREKRRLPLPVKL